MATYVLIHGAGSDSSYWYRVTPLLEALGHTVVAPDLPCADDTAGLAEYADTVVAAIGDRTDLVVVAQSLGGFTAPLVCERVPVDLLIMVAAMVPSPGESPGDWWANTGWEQARRDFAVAQGRDADAPFDPMVEFLHDLPDDVLQYVMTVPQPGQSGTPFEKPWPLDAWPDVPTRFLLCRDDRFFPADFMRRVVRDRLGLVPDQMDGGHLPALARPADLVDRLEAYRIAVQAAVSVKPWRSPPQADDLLL